MAVLKLRPTKGIAADTPASEVGEDFYTTGSNVQFRKGLAGRILGYRQVYPLTEYLDLQHVQNARVGTTNFWLFYTPDEIHALETGNTSDITPSGGTDGGLQAIQQPWQYASTLLNGIPVFTNGLDPPQYWGGDVGTPFTELPAWPEGTICKWIGAAHRYFLVALDIDGPSGHFESRVMISDAAEPGTVPASWDDGDPATLAITFELGDTPGPALCGLMLRGSFIIYKRASTYALDYQDGAGFSVRTLFTSSGALTRHAVADINGQHFVVTDGDIILTDGTTRTSVAQGRMKDYLFNQMDQTNYENLFVIFNRARNEVWVHFPVAGSDSPYCTRALVYDVSNDAFGVRETPPTTSAAIGIVNDTATSELIEDQLQIIATDTRYINQQNFSFATENLVIVYDDVAEMHDTQDNVALAASVGKYDMTMPDQKNTNADIVKLVRKVHVRATPGYGTLYVRAGGRMTPTDDITWSNEVALTEPAQIANLFASGRYISVEVRSEDSNRWLISGIDIDYDLRGRF